MSYRSNLAAVEALFQQATDAGLVADASVVQREVKRRLAHGYTTGLWVTGHVMGSVNVSEPTTEGGDRLIRVGTNVLYALYWELGFNQRLIVWVDQATGKWYSRPGPTRFVRKEIWLPALRETAEQQRTAFHAAFGAVWGSGPAAALSEAADD